MEYLPPELTIPEYARLVGWNPKRAYRACQAGLFDRCVSRDVGRRVILSTAALRRHGLLVPAHEGHSSERGAA